MFVVLPAYLLLHSMDIVSDSWQLLDKTRGVWTYSCYNIPHMYVHQLTAEMDMRVICHVPISSHSLPVHSPSKTETTLLLRTHVREVGVDARDEFSDEKLISPNMTYYIYLATGITKIVSDPVI